jgi:predicted MFS family arabinose efflux permease
MTGQGSARSAAAQVNGPSPLKLAVAGSAAVATAFGMARYGYGLLLPDIQDDLAVGVGALGVIGALAYVSYLLGTAVVAWSVERAGERATVVVGGLLAVVGTVLVAVAAGPVLLGTGVAVAGASAGLVYAPFGEAVRRLPPVVRARTLATISSGTGWGVAVAAPIAVLTGDAWRIAYVGFAACAACSTVLAARTLPGRTALPADRRASGFDWRRAALPMLVASLLIGLGSATFWTFAVDEVRAAGVDPTAARIVLGVAGVASLCGVAAADVVGRLGARLTFGLAALLEAGAIAVLATVPDDLAAVLVAAAVFGVAYNVIVAVTVLWGTRLYRDRPAAGVAAAMGAQGVGLLFGPLTGGVLAEVTSMRTALLGGAAIVGAVVFLAPRRDVVRERGAEQPG